MCEEGALERKRRAAGLALFLALWTETERRCSDISLLACGLGLYLRD